MSACYSREFADVRSPEFVLSHVSLALECEDKQTGTTLILGGNETSRGVIIVRKVSQSSCCLSVAECPFCVAARMKRRLYLREFRQSRRTNAACERSLLRYRSAPSGTVRTTGYSDPFTEEEAQQELHSALCADCGCGEQNSWRREKGFF